LPALGPVEAKKLKFLTIVSLASKNGELSYDTLKKALQIEELRELEDIILDCIYQGLIGGKIDQQQQKLFVDFAVGRDVRDKDLKELQVVLTNWSNRSASLIKVIEDKIAVARSEIEVEKMRREDFNRRVSEVKENIRAIMEAQQDVGKRQGGMQGMHQGGGRQGGRDPRDPRNRGGGGGFKQGFFQ
jgi:hypothetical protein